MAAERRDSVFDAGPERDDEPVAGTCAWWGSGAPGLHGRGWHDADRGAWPIRLVPPGLRAQVDRRQHLADDDDRGRPAAGVPANGSDSIDQTGHSPATVA